jgi:hypothetical protein
MEANAIFSNLKFHIKRYREFKAGNLGQAQCYRARLAFGDSGGYDTFTVRLFLALSAWPGVFA